MKNYETFSSGAAVGPGGGPAIAYEFWWWWALSSDQHHQNPQLTIVPSIIID